MTENIDHETGGTFVSEDVITEQCGNTKMILVQGAAPDNAYDGQIHIDTDDDPPSVKVYDATNTAWMSRTRTHYESHAVAFQKPTSTPIINGDLVLKYDSENLDTYLYMRSNSDWYAIT